MSKQFFQNNYNAGDNVSAKVDPSINLIIRRYIDQVYYCKQVEAPEKKELVFYERELVEDNALKTRNKQKRS
jgi:hypothetical protein